MNECSSFRRRCAPQAKEGAPIFSRACARRAASAGVCRGSAFAAGRPPGGPPEAMVREEMMPTSSYTVLFDVGSRNHFTKKSNLAKFYENTSNLAIAPDQIGAQVSSRNLASVAQKKITQEPESR